MSTEGVYLPPAFFIGGSLMANKKILHETKIVVVGTGGTGGILSGKLARYIYGKTSNLANLDYYELILIDGDRVEEKNIARQPFSKDDIGRYKADCLQEAYKEFFDINCTSNTDFIDDCDEFSKICKYTKKFSSSYTVKRHLIIIGCVDNHRARQTMDKFFYLADVPANNDILYIDSANEFDWGTVICGYKDHEGIKIPPRSFFFPDILKSKEKKASELSCGEVNVSAPQHFATNEQAALLCFTAIINFMENDKIIDGVTYFNVFDNAISNRPLSDYIQGALKKHEVKDYLSLTKAVKEKSAND